MHSPEQPKADDGPSPRNARILTWLIKASTLSSLKSDVSAIAKNTRLRAILKLAALVSWLLVAVFAAGTAVTFLSGLVGALAAWAILSGAFAVVAVVLQLIDRHLRRNRPTLHLQTPFPALAPAVRSGELDDTALGALLLAALAGIFMGVKNRR